MTRTIYTTLSQNQKDSIRAALGKRKGVTLMINPNKPGADPIPLTDAQSAKVLRSGGKPVSIHLSHTQLKSMGKSGGFAWLLPLLAAAATSAVGAFASHGAKKGAEKLFGKGLAVPGKKIRKSK